MLPYRIEYTESEYDIHNTNLLYKIPPECQNTFEMLDLLGRTRKKQKKRSLFQYIYKFHRSSFVFFVKFCEFGDFCIYIYIYIYYGDANHGANWKEHICHRQETQQQNRHTNDGRVPRARSPDFATERPHGAREKLRERQ